MILVHFAIKGSKAIFNQKDYFQVRAAKRIFEFH